MIFTLCFAEFRERATGQSRAGERSGRDHAGDRGHLDGGFGAVKQAPQHPELFIFAGGVSSAIDVPRRTFSIKRLQQSRHYRAIFGPSGNPTRRNNDPCCFSSHSERRSRAILFSDLWGRGRSTACKPRICRAARPTSLSLRVSHCPRRSRLEPMECVASPAVSKSA